MCGWDSRDLFCAVVDAGEAFAVSSPKAIVTQKDVTRIVKGAMAAGIRMGIVVKNGEVRFLPVDEIKSEEQSSAIERWRALRDAGEA